MNQDQLRDAITRELGWTHIPTTAQAWDEAVAAAARVVAPLLADRDRQVAELKAAIADIDAHATPVGLLHNDDPEGSPHHYLLTVGALHRALGKAYTAEPCERERTRLRAELERSEASRRDWAAEAARLERGVEDAMVFFESLQKRADETMEESPGALAAFGCWTTAWKTMLRLLHPGVTGLLPEPVCACLTPEGAAQVAAQPKWSLPVCCVHPDRGGNDELA